MQTKNYIIAITIPISLVAGIITLFVLYRSNVEMQLTIQKDRLVYQPGYLQSQLFLTELNDTFDSLSALGTRLSLLAPEDRGSCISSVQGFMPFSRIELIGQDALLFDSSGAPVTVTGEQFYANALAGKRCIEPYVLDSAPCFALAVPFSSADGQTQALVGFLSEASLLELLNHGGSQVAFKTLLFDRSGQIIAGGSQIPLFADQSNLFTAFAALEDRGVLPSGSLEHLRSALGSSRANSIDIADRCITSGDGYYTCHPIGINGWYILDYIRADYVKISSLHTTRQAEFMGGLVLLSALLALVLVDLLHRQRLTVAAEHRGSRIAYTVDPLTGLYNKCGFEKRTMAELEKAPPEKICALVSFEVVAFRSYNTLYGFEAGDELLRTIARIIGAHTQEHDVAGRLYADHFVWYLCRDTKEDIYATLRECVHSSRDSGLPFFLCAGIYQISDRTMHINEMTDYASIAKNTIKYKFTTGIAIYDDSMLECQKEDAALVGNMMSGLENGEFIAYYQPKYSLNSESIVSAEALVRWRKPDGEIIMPGRFIELFEKNGFIRRLDYYMFDNVCSMLSEALQAGRPVVPISINFSRVHLYDAHFPDRIAAIAEKYDVDTRYLVVELTESAFIMEGQTLIEVVDRLHKHGFAVAIDDFGSGFSSLNMLKDVDVDELKIDMKFLEGFERGGKVGTVVTSVIRMAKWLGIPAVAEGVETREQIDFLRTLGCDMIQGYYYSRPIPREEFETKLQEGIITAQSCEKPAAITLENINAVLGADSLVTALIDGIFGGFGLYAFSNNRLEAIRVNRAYIELLGYPDMGAFSRHSLNVLTQVFPDDVEALCEAVRVAVRTEKVQRLEVRRFTYTGSVGNYRCYIKHVGGTVQEPLICISFIDATERIRAEREKELTKYSEALYSIFDSIYEFNYSANLFRMLSEGRQRCTTAPDDLDKRERNWLDNIIYPPDRERVEALVLDVHAERVQYPTTIEYRIRQNGELRWISSTLVEISGGSFLMCSIDITRKKQFEKLVERMEDTSPDGKAPLPPTLHRANKTKKRTN
ncbi:MAG: EAL domain-containing protein [Oscillospiraceae bacterium]